MASASLARDFERTMGQDNMTQMQFAVLELINANAYASQAGVARALVADRATMMAVVDRLLERKYLTKVPSKVDRRRQDLKLTKLGLASLNAAHRKIEASEARFTSGLGTAKAGALVALLSRIHGADMQERP
jgi:DNA-binding MarR family transcriptional regulator